ncbi:MAG: hypothetical protein KIT31_28220 [Deltaproteobacteria bacterium]|nr:hypothetical protein [Deltaproteobacteria bacterium]
MSHAARFHVDFLRTVFKSGGRIAAARFTLQRGGLGAVDPTFVLTLEQNGVLSLQELPWSTELEEFLLFERQLAMTNEDDETERLAAILLNNVESAKQLFGEDFARAVLVEVLRARPTYQLDDVLRRCPTYAPSRTSEHHANASEFLGHSIDGLYNNTHLGLHYKVDVATRLVRRALVIVLEETFYITDRHMAG